MDFFLLLRFPEPQKPHLNKTGENGSPSKYVSHRKKGLRSKEGHSRLRHLPEGALGSYLILTVTLQGPNVQVQVFKKLT